MKLTIKATGIKEALQQVSKEANRKREDIKKVVRKTAILIEGDAKNLCPVDTGRLRASIDSSFPQDYQAVVGTNVEYAEAIENGGSSQAPNGFLFPATELNREGYINDIINVLKS